jgi:hypothetical protein
VKKHLGIRKRYKTIDQFKQKTPKRAVPVYIHNYFMDFIYTLFPFIKQGEPVYITNIPTYNIHLNLQLSNTVYIGRMNEIPGFDKYEAFVEEPLDPYLEGIEIEEFDVVPIYQLGQGKIIYIRAEDFQATFFLTPPTTRARMVRIPESYQYFYVRALEKIFKLRDYILMYPTQRIPRADPRLIDISWNDVVNDCVKTENVIEMDIMDYPHLVDRVSFHFEEVHELREFPPFPRAEEQNARNFETIDAEKRASPAPD